MSWAPLGAQAGYVLLLARLIVGVVMVYYGWPKVRDPRKNAKDFEDIGFRPGMLWGSVVLIVEFFGGVALILGIFVPAATALFGFEMLIGAIWKVTKAGKRFPDYSYDLLLSALCLVFLAFGPGAFALG